MASAPGFASPQNENHTDEGHASVSQTVIANQNTTLLQRKAVWHKFLTTLESSNQSTGKHPTFS